MLNFKFYHFMWNSSNLLDLINWSVSLFLSQLRQDAKALCYDMHGAISTLICLFISVCKTTRSARLSYCRQSATLFLLHSGGIITPNMVYRAVKKIIAHSVTRKAYRHRIRSFTHRYQAWKKPGARERNSHFLRCRRQKAPGSGKK